MGDPAVGNVVDGPEPDGSPGLRGVSGLSGSGSKRVSQPWKLLVTASPAKLLFLARAVGALVQGLRRRRRPHVLRGSTFRVQGRRGAFIRRGRPDGRPARRTRTPVN